MGEKMSVTVWRNNFGNFEKQADAVEALRLLRTALQKAISVEWSGNARAT